MDGLVSTGNEFPNTILKRLSSNAKKNQKKFINIFEQVVNIAVKTAQKTSRIFSLDS